VKLVDATGPPRWHAWKLTPSSLGESSSNDRSASFQTNLSTFLELIRDPGIERYRVTAELRHMGGDPPSPGGAVSSGFIGFYCGHDEQWSQGNKRINSFVAIQFADIEPLRVPGPPSKTGAVFFDGLYVQSPEGRTPTLSSKKTSFVAFTPRPGPVWPGKWRKLRFEITPNLVRASWWDDTEQKFVLIQELTGNEMHARYAAITPRVQRYAPESTVVPQWSPRLPMGIIAYSSTVSFRNVVIEPIP
jgi:hypothetical protein